MAWTQTTHMGMKYVVLTFACWATIDIETITNDFSSLNLPNFGSRLMMIFDIAILQVDSSLEKWDI